MSSNPKDGNFSKTIALIAGVLVTFSGLIFTLSWHFGWDFILLAPPSIEYVSYASSISIFFSGLAILCLFIPGYLIFSNILGLIILLIALMRMAQLAFKFRFGITELLAPYIPLNEVSVVMMPGIIAIGFILIGSILLVWSKTNRPPLQSILILLGSLIVFLMGVSSTASYIVPIPFSFVRWGTPLNFYSQISAMLIGIGLMASAYYYDIHLKQNLKQRLPLILATLISLFSILTGWSVALEKAHIVGEINQLKLGEIKTNIDTKFQEELTSLKQLSSLVEHEKTHSFAPKIEDISLFFQTHKDLKNVSLLDENFSVRSIIPENSTFSGIKNQLSNEDKQQLKESILQKKTFLIIVPQNNAFDLFMIRPVFWNQSLQGFVAFDVDLKSFFNSTFGNSIGNDYTVFVNTKNMTIFSINDTDTTSVKQWKAEDILNIENLDFTLKIFPTQHLLDIYINRTIIYLIVFGGSMIALSVGALTYFWQLTNSKISEIETFKNQLLNTKQQQIDTLKSAQIGTWMWNLKNNEIQIDKYARILFGVDAKETKGNFQEVFTSIDPTDNEQLQNDFKKCIETGSPVNCSFRVIWPNQSLHWLISKGKVFYDENNHPEKMKGITWEITPIKNAAILLEVSEEISKILSKNAPIPETFDRIIQTLYYYLDWSVMILWLINPKTKQLKLSRISHIPSINIPQFEQATKQLSHIEEETTINQVLSTYRPLGINDVTEDPHFLRTKEAKEESIKGAFAIPILEGSHIIGILELYKQKPFIEEVDKALLNLMSALGIGVGQYIQRKNAQESIIELAAIVTNAQDAVYSLTLDGIIKNWNAGAEKIFGWKAEEIVGKSIKTIYPSDQFLDLDNNLKKLIYGRNTVHFEIQCLRKDGTLIWVDKTIIIIKNTLDQQVAIACIDRDISKEKQMRDALSVSEKKFRDFVEATEEWFWEIDNNLNLIYTNPIIKNILGYSPEEIMNKEILTLLPLKVQNDFVNQIKNSIQVKEGWGKRTTEWLHKNGSIRWLESNAHPILNEKDNVIGFRGADRDVTERKLIEKSKNEFISMVNHELRTPLTSIIGALGLMYADPSLINKLKELCEIAYRNSERLNAIINDILDIEKIELGQFNFDLKPASLVKLIDEGIAASEPMATKFGIHIKKEGLNTDAKIFVDHRRLIQVIMNLISNAIKFSPIQSSIYISTSIENHHARISIRDEGIGISEEFKPKIFEKFAQADFSDSRNVTGTGLGLNICKSLVEGMKGTIAFKSKQGAGTTFYIDLPLLKE